MAKAKNGPEFRPQRRNANKHTPRGIGMLEQAMRQSGYVAPMTVAADGEAIDGSARMEVAEVVFEGVEPIVVDHDGTRPIIMRRTDIPNADDPRAVRIALEANRIAQVDLDFDNGVLAEIRDELPDVLGDMWFPEELDAFHLSTPSLDDMAEKYGEYDERDGWPTIRLHVPPETKEQWDSLMLLAPGENEADRVLMILRAVDKTTLGA